MSKEEENKEIKEKSSLSYTGKVTIKKVKNGKVIKTIKGKNQGTSELFYFLAHCLAGDLRADYQPKYIRLFDESDNNLSVNAIPFSKVQVIQESSNYATEYTFLIPVSTIKVTSTEVHIKKIRIYNFLNKDTVDGSGYSAEYILTTKESNNFVISGEESVDTSILLTWVLEINN